MRIPESQTDRHGYERAYFEKLSSPQSIVAEIGRFRLTILHEKLRPGWSYGCSPEDVIHLLSSAVSYLPSLPDVLVFRQPTKKQTLLAPVWGRLLYRAEIGRLSGSAIVLEAQETGSTLRWPRRLKTEDQAEFERLRADGHRFIAGRRYWETELEPEGLRNTLLYRTLLHEIGHWVHYHKEVLSAGEVNSDGSEHEAYLAKPASEREAFAHAFASNVSDALRLSGIIPFAQCLTSAPQTDSSS